MTIEKLWEWLNQSKPHLVLQFGQEMRGRNLDQELKDQISWVMGYAHVELKQFGEARSIWREIFERTFDHKALHQLGMVERAAQNYAQALELFEQESVMIENDDFARAINLYELALCHLLLGNREKAKLSLEEYEQKRIGLVDLVEEACFYRLKGDFLKSEDQKEALKYYHKALTLFETLKDDAGALEVKARISSLSKIHLGSS